VTTVIVQRLAITVDLSLRFLVLGVEAVFILNLPYVFAKFVDALAEVDAAGDVGLLHVEYFADCVDLVNAFHLAPPLRALGGLDLVSQHFGLLLQFKRLLQFLVGQLICNFIFECRILYQLYGFPSIDVVQFVLVFEKLVNKVFAQSFGHFHSI